MNDFMEYLKHLKSSDAPNKCFGTFRNDLSKKYNQISPMLSFQSQGLLFCTGFSLFLFHYFFYYNVFIVIIITPNKVLHI